MLKNLKFMNYFEGLIIYSLFVTFEPLIFFTVSVGSGYITGLHTEV